MSYKYNPYRDTFTHIDDEESITAYGTGTVPNIKVMPVYSYPVVCLADECIERIADAVVKKLKEREEHENR